MKKIIGNTPMIKINYRYLGKTKSIYAKLEYYNLTGSIKDRIADYIIKKAKKEGKLKEGMSIIEATSGNTGISFAALGAYYHHPVIIFMPDWVSVERVKLMEMYHAKVILISKEEGGFLECIRRADQLAQQIGGFRPNQFENKDNVEAHYKTTGFEIVNQLNSINGFVSGIGTGGTLIGIGKKLKEQDPTTKLVALEPKEAPLLTNGTKIEPHLIEGIGDDFIPKLVDRTLIDDIYLIHDQDAVNMSRKLASTLGLGVGISAGANFLASILLEHQIGGNIITIFPDDNKKYLSTTLTDPIDLNTDFLSNQVELLDFQIVDSKSENML